MNKAMRDIRKKFAEDCDAYHMLELQHASKDCGASVASLVKHDIEGVLNFGVSDHTIEVY